jgi:hypothetical protein
MDAITRVIQRKDRMSYIINFLAMIGEISQVGLILFVIAVIVDLYKKD